MFGGQTPLDRIAFKVNLLPLSFGLNWFRAFHVAAAWLAHQARKLIGGYTGDVLGAAEQPFEAGFFIAIAAMAG